MRVSPALMHASDMTTCSTLHAELYEVSLPMHGWQDLQGDVGCVCHMHCSDRSLLYSMALRMDVKDQACHATVYCLRCPPSTCTAKAVQVGVCLDPVTMYMCLNQDEVTTCLLESAYHDKLP